MSKLSENLKACTTGVRVAPMWKMDYVSCNTSAREVPPYLIQYDLRCNIGCSFFVNENDTQALNAVITKTKRVILEEVFGEFRPDLYKLEMALCNNDCQEAKDILSNVMKNMFGY